VKNIGTHRRQSPLSTQRSIASSHDMPISSKSCLIIIIIIIVVVVVVVVYYAEAAHTLIHTTYNKNTIKSNLIDLVSIQFFISCRILLMPCSGTCYVATTRRRQECESGLRR